ncbi:MAG TPA: Zn-dependent alcohol dehydrogenase [Acidimicrobiales bacterium]|nr:Zn-dependent alcohol dehydrogenase [Acidimicrobiales bacterium]
MRAALLEAPNTDLKVVDDIDIAPPGPGQIRVRVVNCGVCHSDLHVVDGGLPGMMPTVLGHEAGGIVEEIGAGVLDLAVGDKVIMTLRPVCGRCYFCVRSQPSLCSGPGGMLAMGPPPLSRGGEPVYPGIGMGAFAEQVIVYQNAAVKVPDDTPLEIACVIGCAVQTGVGAVLNTAQVEAGATVLVQGLGGVGMSIVQGARIAGASQVIVSDPVAERRDLAAKFGATSAIDPTAQDVVSAVQAATGQIGIDYAFDAVGVPALVETGLNACRPGGMTVCVGVPKMTDAYTVQALFFAMGEKKLTGCFLGSSDPQREFPRLLDLWRHGRLDLEGLVTARRPLDEINEAFADMKAGHGLRTVLDIG